MPTGIGHSGPTLCGANNTARGYPITQIYRAGFWRDSDQVELRPCLPDAADPKAGALVLVTRPRGFFDFGRDHIEIGGRKAGGAMDIASENTLCAHAPGPPGQMQVHYNGERATGQTWPLADRHMTVIELGA